MQGLTKSLLDNMEVRLYIELGVCALEVGHKLSTNLPKTIWRPHVDSWAIIRLSRWNLHESSLPSLLCSHWQWGWQWHRSGGTRWGWSPHDTYLGYGGEISMASPLANHKCEDHAPNLEWMRIGADVQCTRAFQGALGWVIDCGRGTISSFLETVT